MWHDKEILLFLLTYVNYRSFRTSKVIKMCEICLGAGWAVEYSKDIVGYSRLVACPNLLCMHGALMRQSVLNRPAPWMPLELQTADAVKVEISVGNGARPQSSVDHKKITPPLRPVPQITSTAPNFEG